MEENTAKWYVIHTYSTYESAVKTNLEKMIENNNLHKFIHEISIPVEKDIVEKNGKRKVVERKKFPAYVFIKMVYTDNLWYLITNTRGVTGFVGPGGKGLPLTAAEIKRMGLEKIDASDFDIQPGDNVRVIRGCLVCASVYAVT
jgi:transcriptional antiterminator NusG